MATTGKDRCSKGTSCGLSCISVNKDCIKDFPPKVQPFVQKLADKLSQQYGADRASQEVDVERAKMLDILKEPNEDFAKLLSGKSEEDQIFFTEMRVLVSGKQRDKGEKFQYSDEEAMGLNSRSKDLIGAWDKTKEAGFTPEGLRTPGGVADYVKTHRPYNVSDEDLELFWKSIPDSAKKNLTNMGDAKGKYWKGDSLDTEAIPTGHGNATEMRGKMLLKIYMQQGGRDLYTGQRLPLSEADLEHIIPLSKGGKNSEDPANWGFIRTGINAGRGDKDLGDYTREALKKNLNVDNPGDQPDQKAVEALKKKWVKTEEDNISKRKMKAAAVGTDWAAADDGAFNEALKQFKSQKKDYNMVLAIVGKEGVSTTMELPGTAAQIAVGRNGRDYWMTVGTYRSDKLPKGESIASYTAAMWKANPDKRQMIEDFWRQTQLEAQKAWQDSDALNDPKTAKAKAKEIATDVIKQRTEELITKLEG